MAFITVDGENLIALKQGSSTTLVVANFVLANIPGLGAEPSNRIEALPASGDIVHTQNVSHQGYVNANQVVFSLTMDSTIGTFDFNWVGLQADDGTLVAVSYVPTQHKSANAGTVPGNNLTRNFLLAFSGIAATTAISVPAATWQIDFTTRLLQIDERERLSNFDVYGQGAFFGTGFMVSLVSAGNYKIAAGIGYVGGIRCELLSDAAIAISGFPKAVWVDASLQGDINGVAAVFSFSATSSTMTNYTDGSGFKHFVAQVASIDSTGVVTDNRSAAVNSFMPVQQGGGIGQLLNKIKIGFSALGRLKASVDSTDLGNFVFDSDLKAAWPVGFIMYRAANVVPDGWLEADGSSVSAATFSTLFALIGYSYGGSGGWFNLPDLRGEFLRGWDHGRGVDITQLSGKITNGSDTVTGLRSTSSLKAGMSVSGTGIASGITILAVLSGVSVKLSAAATATGTVVLDFYGRKFGSWQESDNLAHTHTYHNDYGSGASSHQYSDSAGQTDSTGSSGGYEARPRNFALLVLIKT